MSGSGYGSGGNSSIKAKRRMVISFFIFTVISSLSLILVVKNHDLNDIENERMKLNQRLVGLKESEMQLRKEIEKLEDPAYVANLARKDYYLSKKDEYIFRTN